MTIGSNVSGGHAVAEATDEAVYLAIALRNVGSGLAVLDRWDFYADSGTGDFPHREPEAFRRLTRDLYVPAGDIGFWQGAFRDRSDPVSSATRDAITQHRMMTVELLYGDPEGGQRTISRFALIPRLATVSRHWNLDRAEPLTQRQPKQVASFDQLQRRGNPPQSCTTLSLCPVHLTVRPQARMPLALMSPNVVIHQSQATATSRAAHI